MKISQRVQVQPGRPAINTSQKQNSKVDKNKTQALLVSLKLHKPLMRKIIQNIEIR